MKKIFSSFKLWKKIFHHYQQNAGKNFFSATSRMQWKKIHIKSYKYSKMFSNILIFFWRKGHLAQRNKKLWTCRRSNPWRAVCFTEENRWMRWKRNFTAKKPQIVQKIIAFNGKRCGRFAVKKSYFRSYSPLILYIFLTEPRPGKWSDGKTGRTKNDITRSLTKFIKQSSLLAAKTKSNWSVAESQCASFIWIWDWGFILVCYN